MAAYKREIGTTVDPRLSDGLGRLIAETAARHNGSKPEYVAMAAHQMLLKHKGDLKAAKEEFGERLAMITSQLVMEHAIAADRYPAKDGRGAPDVRRVSVHDLVKMAESQEAIQSNLKTRAPAAKPVRRTALQSEPIVSSPELARAMAANDVANGVWNSRGGELMLAAAVMKHNVTMVLKHRIYMPGSKTQEDTRFIESEKPDARVIYLLLEQSQTRGQAPSGGHFSATNVDGVLHHGYDPINEQTTAGDGHCFARATLSQIHLDPRYLTGTDKTVMKALKDFERGLADEIVTNADIHQGISPD